MPGRRDRSKGFSSDPFVSFVLNGHYRFTNAPDGWVQYSDSGDVEWANASVGAAVMSDGTTVTNSVGDFVQVSPVDHIKVVGSNLVRTHTEPWDHPLWYGECTTRFHGDAPFVRGPGVHALHEHLFPAPPDRTLASFAYKALEEMCSQFPPEIDAAAALVELRELPQLGTTLLNSKNVLENALGRRFDGTIQEAASAWAGFGFGWAPFLGDLQKAWNIPGIVKKRLKWLRDHRGFKVRVASRDSYAFEENEFTADVGSYVGPHIRQLRKSQVGKLSCTARVRQNLPWLDTWEGYLQGVIQTMGLNRPFQTIWNLLPFSWAVDSFASVGDYISSISFQNAADWEITDVCWSFVTDYRFELQRFDTYGMPSASAGNYTVRRYSRNFGFPPRAWVIQDPSARQLGFLAAVGIVLGT